MNLFKSGEDIVRFAEETDIQIIADNMRESDRNEVWASDNITPIQAVSISFNNSAVAWTVVSKGQPVVMFGVCPIFWAGREANVWLLATNDFCNISGKFLKRSREFIKLMLECYPHLYNYVDCRNLQTIRWLEFCGAKFNSPEEFGIEHKMFQYFEFRNESIFAIQKQRARDYMMEVQDKISTLPGAMFNDCFPLKHTFFDGGECKGVVREILMPKGALIVSKIHRFESPFFLLKGDISIFDINGVTRIKAPYSGITKAGTKRILYIHEESLFSGVIITNETDLKKIEENVVVKSFDEIDLKIIDNAVETIRITENIK